MKIFPIEKDGKTYWVSRSVAVVVYVYQDGRILANKRGKGLANNVGKWNCPSGFVDYGETVEEAACREVFEETGINIVPNLLTMMEVDSDPNRPGENILIRFKCDRICNGTYNITNKYAEANEVEEIKWIPLDEVDNYDWVSPKHKRCIFKYE